MPIIIKEIQVKAIITKDHQEHPLQEEQWLKLKKELMKDLKEWLHREQLRKQAR